MSFRILCVLFTFLFLITNDSFSLPRFSLAAGGQCIDCHVNPTGGQMRNRGGWLFSKNSLSMVSPREDDLKLNNMISDNIAFGFDFRTQYLGYFRDSVNRSDFQKMSGAVYLNVDLSDKITTFAKYDFLTNNWEAYGILNVLPGNGYLKVGTFTPNYGVRLDDHTAYTRGGDFTLLSTTGSKGMPYDPYYVETGIEAGFNINDMSLLTFSVGSPFNKPPFLMDPAYTARLEVTPSVGNLNLLLGGSYANYKKQSFLTFPPEVNNISLYGGFLGFGISGFTLTADYNIGNNYLMKDSTSSFMMLEAAYRIMKGLSAVVRYDRYDPSTNAEKDDLSRVVVGFEYFPYSFVEIRPQFRINMEEPKINNNAFVIQFHLFY